MGYIMMEMWNVSFQVSRILWGSRKSTRKLEVGRRLLPLGEVSGLPHHQLTFETHPGICSPWAVTRTLGAPSSCPWFPNPSKGMGERTDPFKWRLSSLLVCKTFEELAVFFIRMKRIKFMSQCQESIHWWLPCLNGCQGYLRGSGDVVHRPSKRTSVPCWQMNAESWKKFSPPHLGSLIL